MEKKEITITECFKCGTRYENYFNASPCCKSIVVKVDEQGNRTSVTFLSALSFPRTEPDKESILKEQLQADMDLSGA
ncbi:hypothetical protein [uncultured Chryseobacterium sp.]|uniref:hypothetical protein n=1 Tax=uncultured Chryseobacterium sp. TaxID=259322 RepID=UPI0025E7FD79|nr:hypothetical protein [uncultured Chryseobacterium sp.]